MTPESVAVIVIAAGVAGASLLGAVATRRILHRARVALVGGEALLDARAATAAPHLSDVRDRLAGPVRADLERTLWALALVDARLDAARAGIEGRRAASDTLRASMLRNRGALTRIRNSAPLLMRAIELRRDFLA